jgi:predicted phosphate transport protein (TIGR00153 family)
VAELGRAGALGYTGPAHPRAARPRGVPEHTANRRPHREASVALNFRLFPQDEDFFALFRKQAACVRLGCEQLHEMVEKFDNLEERARRLKDVEHEGDLITHEIFERLNRTFITPLEREDIHDLGSGLDDVLDSVEAIGSRLVLFRILHTTPEAVRLTQIVVDCSIQIEKAVENLKNFKNLMAFTIEVNRLENEADILSREVVADLFSGKHDVLDVLRWKEIYGRLESATDQCEDVANTIESIVIKNH